MSNLSNKIQDTTQFDELFTQLEEHDKAVTTLKDKYKLSFKNITEHSALLRYIRLIKATFTKQKLTECNFDLSNEESVLKALG